MKKLSTLLAFALAVIISSSAFAQSDPYAGIKARYDPNEKLTKEQADSIIAQRRVDITDLQSNLNMTKDAVAKANADIQQRMADNGKCREAYYALMGTDRNGFNAYREHLARTEQEMNALKSMSAGQLQQSGPRVAALEQDIRSLRDNKIVVVPDHFNRVLSMSNSFQTMKKGMVPPNVMYTVGTWKKDRDCLWNIAKKPEMYNDPFAWPKIWHNNQDQIKNPDLIYPGQQLSIVKSEVTPADKDLTGYRHRRAN